jgi:hypothetical protein
VNHHWIETVRSSIRKKTMVAANRSYLTPQSAIHRKPDMPELTAQHRRHFDDHRRASREGFTPGALPHENDARQPLTADDLRIHAWLIERQAQLDRDRSGWRAKARRLFHW